jgi:spore germination cell wall hydrolase CwlJ-like protein
MLHKSILGVPMLLLGASCVPPPQTARSAGPVPAAEAPAAGAATARAVPLPPPEAIAPGHAAEPFVVAARDEREIAASLQCLTAAVYYEARSESLEGQRAVAQVVLNRVRHPAFPKSLCGVVYQGSHRRTGCQFSFTCDGSLRAGREPAAWARARRVAATALEGGVYGPVGLATHYHTTAIRPWWAAAMRRAVTVGSHIFYRWSGEWGDPKSFRRPYAGGEAEPEGTRSAPADEVGTAFGVTVHHVRPAGLAAGSEFGIRVHRSDSEAGVRVHDEAPEQDKPEDGTAVPRQDAVPAR